MKPIAPVKKGPKGLVSVLNSIIGAFNGLTLVQGAGIYITPTATGWIISTVPTSTDGSSSSSAPDLTARVLALETLLADATFQDVDVMDESCARTSIQILSKPA